MSAVKCTSKLIIGLLIGAMLGLWIGVNIGRERPLFSNPFRKESVYEKFRKAGRGLGDAIKESADELHDKLKE
ncbi:MAG: hypothetical protein C4581_11245 [Nitrospiraceae bacterium]|nr:MAG: hypothetical protein C4581_11245 [Nitrospiraceae bacterium]